VFNEENTHGEILSYSADSDWLDPDGGYSDDSKAIARFLKGENALARPPGMNAKEFRAFKANALKFVCGSGHLFRKSNKNMPMRRVIDNSEVRQEILL
jgi:hypothetical protein